MMHLPTFWSEKFVFYLPKNPKSVIFHFQVSPLNLRATAAHLIVSGRCNKKQIHNIDLQSSQKLVCVPYNGVYQRQQRDGKIFGMM